MQRRTTKQRDTVYEVLCSLYHPTANEVYEALVKVCPSIGRATVFRNLTVLEEEGKIIRLIFPGEGARYDPIIDGHAHFSCKHCGKIIDLPTPKGLSLPVSEDFFAESCSVKYYGVCRECREHSNPIQN